MINLQKINKNVTSDKTKHVLVENEVNELSGKVKLVNLILLMKQNAFIQENFKIIQYLYQLNNLVALLELICENLMECQKKMLKI